MGEKKERKNTQGTAGDPGDREKLKKRTRISFFLRKKNKITFFLHISSSYAKILGETNFHTREFPRSGSKAKDGKRQRKEERLNDGVNNGQATHGARKLPGLKKYVKTMATFVSVLQVWRTQLQNLALKVKWQIHYKGVPHYAMRQVCLTIFEITSFSVTASISKRQAWILD